MSFLVLIEGDVVFMNSVLAGCRVLEKQAFNHLLLHDGFFDNLRHIVNRYPEIAYFFRMNDQHRPPFAESRTPGAFGVHLSRQTLAVNFFLESCDDFIGAGGHAPCACAYGDAGFFRIPLSSKFLSIIF